MKNLFVSGWILLVSISSASAADIRCVGEMDDDPGTSVSIRSSTVRGKEYLTLKASSARHSSGEEYDDMVAEITERRPNRTGKVIVTAIVTEPAEARGQIFRLIMPKASLLPGQGRFDIIDPVTEEPISAESWILECSSAPKRRGYSTN